MQLRDMTVDSAGNTYIAAYRGRAVGSRQVLVMKFDPAGSKLIYTVEFGGSGVDIPRSILADSGGSVYIMGDTTSQDFPGSAGSPLPAPHSTTGMVVTAPFVAKLNPAGTQIVYSVYGRTGEDTVNIAVDGAGDIHLLVAQFPPPSSTAQFLVRKYRADGTALVYETPVAPDWSVLYPVLAVDDQAVANIAGSVASIGFPIHNATSSCASPGATNAYLVRLSPGGDILQSTFLASNGPAQAFALSVQSTGGYIAASIGSGDSQKLGVLRIGPDTTGTTEIALGCYGNAATYQGGPLAPGEIFTIFGEGLGRATGVAFQWGANQLVGTSLSGVAVTFDGMPAPLLYVQSSQINAIAPWGLAGKSETQLCVSYSGKNSCTNVSVKPAAPGIFQYVGPNNTNYAAALNQDGTLNSPVHPAPVGSIVSLYLTGLGTLSPVPIDGSIIQPPLPVLSSQVQASFLGGLAAFVQTTVPTQVLYAGPAPFEVGGLYQVNVQIPHSGALGALTITVQVPDGSTYQTRATIAIQ